MTLSLVGVSEVTKAEQVSPARWGGDAGHFVERYRARPCRRPRRIRRARISPSEGAHAASSTTMPRLTARPVFFRQADIRADADGQRDDKVAGMMLLSSSSMPSTLLLTIVLVLAPGDDLDTAFLDLRR